MKSISIDFTNNMICIMSEGQQGTEHGFDLEKAKFKDFIPEEYFERSSFTWNFEDEIFAVNQDFILEQDCIMTKNDFVPTRILSMRGLKARYDDFLEMIGYEEVNLIDEMDDELRSLLGLDDIL